MGVYSSQKKSIYIAEAIQKKIVKEILGDRKRDGDIDLEIIDHLYFK